MRIAVGRAVISISKKAEDSRPQEMGDSCTMFNVIEWSEVEGDK